MDAVDLFAVALNLPSPWHISQVEFKPSKESSLELHIYIAFQRGGRFPCPQEPCGKVFPLTTPHREHGGISISFNTRPAFMLTFLVFNAKSMG